MSGFAGTWNGPEAPVLLAGFGVVGVDESANASFTAADANNNFSVDGQRRDCHAVSRFIFANFGGPKLRSASQIERNQIAIKRGHKKLVVEHCRAAIDPAKTNVVIIGGNGPLPSPQNASGTGVDGHRGIWAGEVHDVVHNNRRNFIVGSGKLQRPLDLEVADVAAVDFSEWRKALPLEISGIGEPVAGFFVRVKNAFEGHLSGSGRRERGG